VRLSEPARIVLAVPVGAGDAVRALSGDAGVDDLVVLAAPMNFRAVGYWYRDFDQLTDDDVVTLLARASASP
jgi:putative phosphoribosyl transferase